MFVGNTNYLWVLLTLLYIISAVVHILLLPRDHWILSIPIHMTSPCALRHVPTIPSTGQPSKNEKYPTFFLNINALFTQKHH